MCANVILIYILDCYVMLDVSYHQLYVMLVKFIKKFDNKPTIGSSLYNKKCKKPKLMKCFNKIKIS